MRNVGLEAQAEVHGAVPQRDAPGASFGTGNYAFCSFPLIMALNGNFSNMSVRVQDACTRASAEMRKQMGVVLTLGVSTRSVDEWLLETMSTLLCFMFLILMYVLRKEIEATNAARDKISQLMNEAGVKDGMILDILKMMTRAGHTSTQANMVQNMSSLVKTFEENRAKLNNYKRQSSVKKQRVSDV